jgi:hypothetical protein
LSIFVSGIRLCTGNMSIFTNIACAITGRSGTAQETPVPIGESPESGSTDALAATPNVDLHRHILRPGRVHRTEFGGSVSSQFEALCRENEQLLYEQSLGPSRVVKEDRLLAVPSSSSGSPPEHGSAGQQSGPSLSASAAGGNGGGACSYNGVFAGAGITRGVDSTASGLGLGNAGLLVPGRQRDDSLVRYLGAQVTGALGGDLLRLDQAARASGGGGASLGRNLFGEVAQPDIRRGFAQGSSGEAAQPDTRGLVQHNAHYFHLTRIHSLPVLFHDFEIGMPNCPSSTGKQRLVVLPELDLEKFLYHYDLCMRAIDYIVKSWKQMLRIMMIG